MLRQLARSAARSRRQAAVLEARLLGAHGSGSRSLVQCAFPGQELACPTHEVVFKALRRSPTASLYQTRVFAAAAVPQEVEQPEKATPDDFKVDTKADASTPGGEDGRTHEKGFVAPHPGMKPDVGEPKEGDVKPHTGDPGQQHASSTDSDSSYMLSHPVYTPDYVNSIKPKHHPPEHMYEKTGFWAVELIRTVFDTATGYSKKPGGMTTKKTLQRVIFLETIAGVPGMVGAMLRHMKSLRTMNRDHGWIHTLLEEAENERMHLLTFMQIQQPGLLMRGMVLISQGIFFNLYTLFYLISPKHCHAFVGYLEEEAVKTYTHILEELDAGRLPEWKDMDAPTLAKSYWKLPEDAKMRDMILAVRADEACHGHVNHAFSRMKPWDDNPFARNSHVVP